MKRLTVVFLSVLLITAGFMSCSSNDQVPEQTADNSIPMPTGDRLRDIVARNYPDGNVLIGATIAAELFGSGTGSIMDREFSYVTPENDFKQWSYHPDPDTWTWGLPDAWVRHIADNGQVLRMHCPVGPQCSPWAMNDSRTAEELETNLREYLRAVCERYNGVPGFDYMDVVNETTNNNEWHKNKPGSDWDDWECPWYIIGQDTDKNKTPLYIKMAFEIATKYATDMKLIYNHHEDMNAEGSWQLIKDTISYLRAAGLRVDGIGWQAHVDKDWATPENVEKLRELIDWAHGNDLEFHVTEASAWQKDGVTPETLEEQAYTYAKIVEVLVSKRSTGIVGWNTWHIDDGTGWHQEWYGAIFDSTLAAKPAYYAIQKALEEGVN
ncbi:endo-1,4-beta-xylanase [Candidatus Latescibacterota bacterium]